MERFRQWLLWGAMGATVVCWVGCGGSSNVGATVPDPIPPSTAAPTQLTSPHDVGRAPSDPQGAWDDAVRWWESESPCPVGATLFGGPPPDHSDVRCRTDKGKNEGWSTRFYQNGTRAEQGAYHDHFAEGLWLTWDEQGRRVMETPYAQGEKEGVETEWYPDGAIKSQRRYHLGKRHGLTEIWDERGVKRSALDYVDGKQSGAASYWDDQGNLVRVERWEAGQKVESREN